MWIHLTATTGPPVGSYSGQYVPDTLAEDACLIIEENACG